jgi:allantoinase
VNQHIFDLAITGNVLFGSQIIEGGTLLVNGERIFGIISHSKGIQSKTHIRADGKWVLPGVIDSHVHSLSYPGEGFFNSSRSAAAGGVTTIIDMPVDAPKGIATPEALVKKIALVESESIVDVALLGSVKNETVAHIPELREKGVCGFKLALFDTDPDRFPRVHDGQLLEAFAVIKETGLTAGVHAENDEIIKRRIEKYIEQGRTYPRAHCETRPDVSETESVLKALELARATGVRLHLYHLSCSRSVKLAKLFREEGGSVTQETCPHYLIFSEEDMDKLGARIRINPPMRKRAELDLLWDQLSKGEIDCVSSDHAPWPLSHKDKPSIFDNSCGAPGVETLLPLLFSEGVIKGRISIFTLSKVLSENPARIFKLFPKKGILAPGSDADIVILDPKKRISITAEQMHAAAGWTPYEGMEVTGTVDMTILRGKVIFHGGKIYGEKGDGRFVRPFLDKV